MSADRKGANGNDINDDGATGGGGEPHAQIGTKRPMSDVSGDDDDEAPTTKHFRADGRLGAGLYC